MRTGRVYYFEEPLYEGSITEIRRTVCPRTGVIVITPVLPCSQSRSPLCSVAAQANLLREVLEHDDISEFVAWYYTPMAIEFTGWLRPRLTVYDCMDELSAFLGAPPAMGRNETILFQQADLVFTGGASLYESKRSKHDSVHLFPSSVDVCHFASARQICCDPDDQKEIGFPRLGYAGVIDERVDLDLLSQVAQKRPDWQIVMLGPVVKIDPSSLPRHANIHYLGMKPYEELPQYFSGWNTAIIPFAQNESTRFISPTKTLEYLAAGIRVVSTAIRDVVNPYGESGLVEIARSSDEFVSAVNDLIEGDDDAIWRAEADICLSTLSWERTWLNMQNLMIERMAPTSAIAASCIKPIKYAPPALRNESAGA